MYLENVFVWKLTVESQVLATRFETRFKYYNVYAEFTDDSTGLLISP